MRRIFVLLLLLPLAIMTSFAQTQQGYVKTLGRPQKPGKGLADVIIKIAEVPNDVISNHKGEFSFYPNGKKYMLSRIRKNNFQLIDQSLIGRMFPFSPDVPLEIVMVSNQDLINDKQRIEDKAYARAEKNYKKRILELEQQLKQHAINADDAEKVRIKTGENYQRYLNLIVQMAERYAMTDYDGISNANKLIMQCIEEGELERADSLLRSKGDFEVREAELNAQRRITDEAETFVQKSRQVLEAKLQELAQDYYNKHSILLSNYQNDSAAYFLERRSMLDTTRIEWMIDTGTFVNDYLADYRRAIKHYSHAKSISLRLFGEKSFQVAKCNNLIGKSLIEQGLYNRAMDYFVKAQNILEAMPNPNSAELVDCYANMASIFLKVERYPYIYAQKAMKHALDITRNLYGEHDITYAKILMMNADLSVKMGNASIAVKDMYRVQEIYSNLIGSHLIDDAWKCYYLGVALTNTNEYSKGRSYIQEAMISWTKMFGAHHPYVSYAYGALGDSYMKEKNYQKADSCYNAALTTQRYTFGDSHPYIAECQEKLGRLYRKQKKYSEASRYGMEALNVLLQFDEYKENEVITLLQNIDSWLSIMGKVEHSESDFNQLYSELKRLNRLYQRSANKKIRLKNIRI